MNEEGHEIESPPVFRPGDVVRSRDGSRLGVVLHVGQYSEEPPKYELHVDEPDQGVGIWPPWDAVLANDPESVAQAKAFGLRGLEQHP